MALRLLMSRNFSRDMLLLEGINLLVLNISQKKRGKILKKMFILVKFGEISEVKSRGYVYFRWYTGWKEKNDQVNKSLFTKHMRFIQNLLLTTFVPYFHRYNLK